MYALKLCRNPKIVQPTDAIIEVTATAICGSDLHLYNRLMPEMRKGDILGHESMGIVVETGSEVRSLRKGDRVVVPFNIACGSCFFCHRGLFSSCEISNPPQSAEKARTAMGSSPAAMFGYSHMLGGIPGGQAEFLRVPYADVGPLKIESDLPDESVLFLSDIFPTGYMAAENCQIEPGDTVAVWGCGPVGQFAIQSAWMLGAGRVVAIDNVEERLELAAEFGNAETIDFSKRSVHETLMGYTQGSGPDRCIDAVGTEAHSAGSLDGVVDRAKVALMLGTDRVHVLREAIMACRKGGTVSVPGVYIGKADDIPVGAMMNKGLTIRSGQTHTHRYMRPLLELVTSGKIDPTRIITHRASLDDAPELYKAFEQKRDGCIKVVMSP